MERLDELIAVYDNALSPAICSELIQAFEQDNQGQRFNGRTYTAGLDESLWTEVLISAKSEPSLTRFFLQQVVLYHAKYNERCHLTRPISPIRHISELMIKRYRKGLNERFQVHFDALGDACNRYLVFLWYLNDVAVGGETHFPDLGIKVAPQTGRLLVFPPYWMFQHEGLPPLSQDKYIISTYALYGVGKE